MIKEFDLYKFLTIVTIIILAVSAIGLIDFSEARSIDEMILALDEPLNLKNWHYALIVWLIWVKK